MFSLGLRADVDQLAVGDQLAVLVAQAPDPAAVEVAVDVDADQRGDLLAAVDVTAGDAQAAIGPVAGRGVGILDDRRLDLGGRVGPLPALGLERVETLPDAPAVVAAVLDAVDHLPEVLSDVAGPQLAGLAVEAELPDVPQADAINLGRPVARTSGPAARGCPRGCRRACRPRDDRRRSAGSRRTSRCGFWPVDSGSSAAPLSPSVM